MNISDYVEIKDASGTTWQWRGRKGHITGVDKYCYSVRTDDGQDIRDVHDHFRVAR